MREWDNFCEYLEIEMSEAAGEKAANVEALSKAEASIPESGGSVAEKAVDGGDNMSVHIAGADSSGAANEVIAGGNGDRSGEAVETVAAATTEAAEDVDAVS